MNIAADEIHIWSTSLDISEQQLQKQISTLNKAELSRAERFHFPLHRHHFIAAHSFLRYVLSKYLNIPPKEIEIEIDNLGKPYLPNSPLQFNLSHSNNLAALAIATNNTLGIDIEFIKQTFDAEIAKHYFHQEETTALYNEEKSKQYVFFYNIWARKEAIIKANGKGLSLPLNKFSTISSCNPKAIFIEEKKWYLYSIFIHSAYASALASINKISTLKFWRWEDETTHTQLQDDSSMIQEK